MSKCRGRDDGERKMANGCPLRVTFHIEALSVGLRASEPDNEACRAAVGRRQHPERDN